MENKLEDIKIFHGKFTLLSGQTTMKGKYIPMNLKLVKLLDDKYVFYMNKYEIEELRFTLGKLPDEHLEVIAICYPKDNYSRKIGRTIVKNRIKEYLKNKYNTEKYPWIWVLK